MQSAVTGNIRPVAVVKLAALGLGADLDFAVGGYGDESADRAELVRRARARATRKYGQDFSGTRTVVVGDTPHDVRGALDAGALAIAVTSGSSPAERLHRAGATAVLPTLHGFPAACAAALAR